MLYYSLLRNVAEINMYLNLRNAENTYNYFWLLSWSFIHIVKISPLKWVPFMASDS